MKFTAKLRHARITPRKLRLVVDLIRGKDYNSAEAILRAQTRRGVYFVRKLLKSAFENAVNKIREKNLEVDVNKLHVVEARVDPGKMIKRWRTAPMGRGVPIKKRMSHISIVLEERELKLSKKELRKQNRAARKKETKEKTTAASAPAVEGGEKKE